MLLQKEAMDQIVLFVNVLEYTIILKQVDNNKLRDNIQALPMTFIHKSINIYTYA